MVISRGTSCVEQLKYKDIVTHIRILSCYCYKMFRRKIPGLSKLPELFLKNKHATAGSGTYDGNNMEIDTSTNDILREVVTFLECLGDAQLPLTLENLREKLLARSKNTLSVTTRVTLREASSPEPYLDMKSGPKSLLLTRNEAQANLEEYVGMEESQKHSRTSSRPHSQQDYYETFENKNQAVENASPAAAADDDDDDDDNDDDGQTLIGIYKNLPAMQIRSKCHKCGPLYRKEGKKLFLSESLNACWIALVGSHLLIYRSERHNRPYAIYPIRGYMARPAPTMILRSSDRRKSDAAFEIYSPGNETLQLIARTPKDMEQWIAKICEVGCSNHNQSKAEDHFEEEEKKKKKKKKRRAVVEGRRSPMCRDANDEAAAVVAKSTVKAKSMSNNNKRKIGRKDAGGRAPPLPARIPRRLPSLPPASPFAILSYEGTVDDNDDNDDIYHKIEDLRNERRYQNMILSKEERADPDADDERRQEEAVAYDDVRARLEEETRSLEEMYDDVVALSRINATSFESERNRANNASVDDGEQGEEEFYDDVENLIANSRFARDGIKDPPQVSNKLEKKSFLGKVLSRRDSPGKSDTHKRPRSKSKVWSNSSLAFDSTMVESQVPTYDDVSDLTPSQKEDVSTDVSGGEDLPEYNCPPPPRPIYQVKSPAESQSPEQTGEFYDDVSAYQERRNENQPNYHHHHHHHQQVTLRAPRVDTRARANEVGHDRATCNADSETNGDSTTCRDEEDTEHYQSPRSAEMGEKEQLYDDIALWADFTARQRDRVGKKESEDAKSVSSEKKAWNRFAVNRKSRATSELNCSTAETTTTTATTKRDGNEGGDEIEASSESNGAMKKNTFQKLISRMENSLAKVSARSPSSLSTGKPSASSNSS